MTHRYPFIVIRPNGIVINSFDNLDAADRSAKRHVESEASLGEYIVAKLMHSSRRSVVAEMTN